MKLELNEAELSRLYSALKYRSAEDDPLLLRLERLLTQALSSRYNKDNKQ